MAQQYVIRIVGHANGKPCPIAGKYLSAYEANDAGGRGTIRAHHLLRHAQRFPDAVAAHAYWTQPHPKAPLRPDGEPNRPLTAYTVEIIPAEAPL